MVQNSETARMIFGREESRDVMRVNAMGSLTDRRNELKRIGLEEKVIKYGANSLRYAEEVARSPEILKFLAKTGTRVDIGGIKISGIDRDGKEGSREFLVGFSDAGYAYGHLTKVVGLDLHYLRAREVYDSVKQDARSGSLSAADAISRLSSLTSGQILDSFEKAICPWKSPESHR